MGNRMKTVEENFVDNLKSAILRNPEVVAKAIEFIASDHPAADLKDIAKDQLPHLIAGIVSTVIDAL